MLLYLSHNSDDSALNKEKLFRLLFFSSLLIYITILKFKIVIKFLYALNLNIAWSSIF